LLNKPFNLTSNSALQKVKKIFNAVKAGHSGSLDPIATGVLLICFGEGTKFVRYLIDLDKRYQVILKLGEKTSTFDSEGLLLKKCNVNCTYTQIVNVLKSFVGKINQFPPLYSAVKYKGKPLYKYIRSGIVDIPVKKRKVIIYQLKYMNQFKNFIELHIWCSKGTYIRSLINDIGDKLQCGAHVIFLNRLKIGSFSQIQSFTLNQLYNLKKDCKKNNGEIYKKLDSLLLPLETPVLLFPIINITSNQSIFFKKGQKILLLQNDVNVNTLVRVTQGETKLFIGIGFFNAKKYLIPHRLFSSL